MGAFFWVFRIAWAWATERRNLDQLLAAELSTQDKLACSIRNHRPRHILGSEPLADTLLAPAPLQADLQHLVGDPAAFAQSRQAMQQQRTQSEQRLAVLKDEFTAKRLPMPGCAEVAGGAAPETLRRWRQGASAIDAAELDAVPEQLRKVCASSDGSDDTLITRVYQALAAYQAAVKVGQWTPRLYLPWPTPRKRCKKPWMHWTAARTLGPTRSLRANACARSMASCRS